MMFKGARSRARLQAIVDALRAEPAGAGLPAPPEPRAIRAGNGFPKVYALAYTADQLREYGEACAKAATRCRAQGGDTNSNSREFGGIGRDQNTLKPAETRMGSTFEGGPSGTAPAAGTEKDAERLRADAARYRWLRDDCPDLKGMTSAWLYEDLDRVIDAAIWAHTKASK